MTMAQMQEVSLPEGVGVEAERPAQQFLRFSVGSDAYAVRIELVREILEVGQMTPLPLMPTFVRGVMNLRGAVVPVVDLSARLGMDPTEIGRRTCVIMVGLSGTQGAQHMGVLVDAVQEVFDVDDGCVETVPRMGTKIDPSFIAGMVRVRGQVTPALDFERTLAEQTLAELIAQGQPGANHAVAATV